MACGEWTSHQIGIGFVCVIGAGLASVLGALIVLVAPSLTRNKLFLAGLVSFASGVMTYISFVDIYIGKSVGHFQDAGLYQARAFVYATLCFFGGFPIAWVLDLVGDTIMTRMYGKGDLPAGLHDGHGHGHAKAIVTSSSSDAAYVAVSIDGKDVLDAPARHECNGASDTLPLTAVHATSAVVDGAAAGDELDAKAMRKLIKVGLLAALAIGFHNTPEGLVTFVSYLDSVSSGITTAVAIAIHNFPEGMVVAVPIYYGTGSRLRALAWASLAGVTEPLGALIGLAVACGGALTDEVFGILFGLVGGIMVYVALKELAPTARQYDPEDRVCTLGMVSGMIIMATSLIAIQYT